MDRKQSLCVVICVGLVLCAAAAPNRSMLQTGATSLTIFLAGLQQLICGNPKAE